MEAKPHDSPSARPLVRQLRTVVWTLCIHAVLMLFLLAWASRSGGAHGPSFAQIAIALINAPADLVAFLLLHSQQSEGAQLSWQAVFWLAGAAQWSVVAFVLAWAFALRTKPDRTS